MGTIFRLLGLGLGILATTTLPAPVAAQVPQTSLRVTVRYTGPGQVDQNRKICMWIFDDPAFLRNAPDAMPIATRTIERNGDAVVIGGIPAGPTWIAVVYDQAGGFQCQGPPPSGSPASAYSENGQPAPITPGANTSVTITFDESVRVPETLR